MYVKPNLPPDFVFLDAPKEMPPKGGIYIAGAVGGLFEPSISKRAGTLPVKVSGLWKPDAAKLG